MRGVARLDTYTKYDPDSAEGLPVEIDSDR
jgi:hypothetical protein